VLRVGLVVFGKGIPIIYLILGTQVWSIARNICEETQVDPLCGDGNSLASNGLLVVFECKYG
jgi:hypothetical protein